MAVHLNRHQPAIMQMLPKLRFFYLCAKADFFPEILGEIVVRSKTSDHEDRLSSEIIEEYAP